MDFNYEQISMKCVAILLLLRLRMMMILGLLKKIFVSMIIREIILFFCTVNHHYHQMMMRSIIYRYFHIWKMKSNENSHFLFLCLPLIIFLILQNTQIKTLNLFRFVFFSFVFNTRCCLLNSHCQIIVS